jgi:transposase
MDLSDAQWEKLRPLFVNDGPRGRGRPARDPRQVLDAILWIMRTGAAWRCLPPHYPPWKTCNQCLLRWTRSRVWDRVFLAPRALCALREASDLL